MWAARKRSNSRSTATSKSSRRSWRRSSSPIPATPLLSRPDKLRAHRVGGYADVALFFDGKTVSILGKNLNAYAQFDAPGNVDQLFEALRAGHGVALPFADLLLTNSYDALVAGVMEAKHIGRGVIDGRECEHLAFRNFDTDWQLWVEVGDRADPAQDGDHQQDAEQRAAVHASRQELEDGRRAGSMPSSSLPLGAEAQHSPI